MFKGHRVELDYIYQTSSHIVPQPAHNSRSAHGCDAVRPPTANSVCEALLAMLKQKGVDFLFVNAGTDHASFAEAYAGQRASRLDLPTPIIGAHENLVAGMAHGYTMI